MVKYRKTPLFWQELCWYKHIICLEITITNKIRFFFIKNNNMWLMAFFVKQVYHNHGGGDKRRKSVKINENVSLN